MSQDRKELLQSLVEKMGSVIRRLHMGQSTRFREFKLSPPQVYILLFIARKKEEVALKDLAETLNVTPGAITQFVDGLAEANLVRREEDARDRRIIRIKLTELARSKIDEFKNDHLASASRIFEALSDEEISQLVKLLEKADTRPVEER